MHRLASLAGNIVDENPQRGDDSTVHEVLNGKLSIHDDLLNTILCTHVLVRKMSNRTDWAYLDDQLDLNSTIDQSYPTCLQGVLYTTLVVSS